MCNNSKQIRVAVCLLLVSFGHLVFARQVGQEDKKVEEKREQIKEGNFALKSSQQPGPLVSFGQNMLDKGDNQFFMLADSFSGKDKEFVVIIPTYLHGIRNDLSLYVQLPILAKYKENGICLNGFQDLLAQLEWAFYDNVQFLTTKQMSIVVNTTLPTGQNSSEAISRFGPKVYGSYGSPTVFMGCTADYFNTAWYTFVSGGAKLSATNNGFTAGKQYLYQFGLSRNVCAKADTYIFNITVEVNGTYREQNEIHGMKDQNSGGNQILLGPSVWFSTPHCSFQAGISGVVYQHLYGIQNKDVYFASVEVGYKF